MTKSNALAASLRKLAARLERIHATDEQPSVQSQSLLTAANVLRNMADEASAPRHP